jgi:hypothetical protein
MGTQGVFSVTEAGKTLIKVICGCNGMNIPKLEQYVQQHKVDTVPAMWMAVKACEIGCDSCLVIQDSTNNYMSQDIVHDLGSRYRIKFEDPRFNPRWEQGIAAFVQVLAKEKF